MEETQKEKQAVPEPIDIITLLHDVLRGVKKLWWACLLLTVLCAAGSWYTAKRAYRPLYRAAASFTVATGSGESGGFSYGFYYNTATASQLARTFPYILESELLTDGIKQALGTDSITASLSASAVEDSNLFTLTATGANAESTLNVLNAAIDCYPEAARYVLGDIKLHMLSAPSLPTTPYNIFDGKRAALTGAAYGLLFGAGLILLYGCTRRTVRREEEIASKLHLLCLGTLPKVVFKKRSKSRRETLTLTNPHVPAHYREAARGLAMRLERRMAASGDKVLHRRGAEPYRCAACSRGLSPREVLAVGENLRGAIASLREDADCVLLIAPESARFAEILPAAESCDAAVYVIEQDRASRTKIKAGIEKLLSCDVTVAGCVLNGVQAGLSGYGYGKYGYGYGYGKYGRYGHYGYGHYGAHRTREETV